MTKPLVLLFIIKLYAQSNVFKFVQVLCSRLRKLVYLHTCQQVLVLDVNILFEYENEIPSVFGTYQSTEAATGGVL